MTNLWRPTLFTQSDWVVEIDDHTQYVVADSIGKWLVNFIGDAYGCGVRVEEETER